MFKLDCAIQAYAWGKRGTNSCVAKFKESQNKEFKIDENKSYAELWMGTHSNGPSMISGETKMTKLNEYIKNEELPFLFKILSVNQALSIQAHPNKRLAQILHSNDPKNYPDSNHKPEMLIALTKFQALCGFRPCEEIKTHFDKIPELAKLCEEKFTGDDEDSLKKCFSSMMNRDEIFIRDIFEDFLKNYKIIQ
jgi:mannose-6-phosphate isomerase